MGLFLFDLVVFLNFTAFCIAVADKSRSGRLRRAFWISAIAFGGAGSALACFLVRHRTRNGEAYAAAVLGALQLALVWWLSGLLG